MRRVSKRRLARNQEVAEWRQALRVRVGRCELCLKPVKPELADVHELVVGCCRALALDKDYATLVLHRACHIRMEAYPIARQMAYLYLHRPQDWDLEAYYTLTKRRWPDMEDVLKWVRKLKGEFE